MALEYALFGERVLVRKIDEEIQEKTEGGIILPNSALERETRNRTTFHGEVVLVGPGAELVEVGDIVVFNVSGSGKLVINDEELYMIPEPNLIGKLVDNGEKPKSE